MHAFEPRKVCGSDIQRQQNASLTDPSRIARHPGLLAGVEPSSNTRCSYHTSPQILETTTQSQYNANLNSNQDQMSYNSVFYADIRREKWYDQLHNPSIDVDLSSRIGYDFRYWGFLRTFRSEIQCLLDNSNIDPCSCGSGLPTFSGDEEQAGDDTCQVHNKWPGSTSNCFKLLCNNRNLESSSGLCQPLSYSQESPLWFQRYNKTAWRAHPLQLLSDLGTAYCRNGLPQTAQVHGPWELLDELDSLLAF